MCGEHLTKAADSIGFACDDLQAAHATADPVTDLIISVLHEQAVDLRSAIDRLINARNARNAT